MRHHSKQRLIITSLLMFIFIKLYFNLNKIHSNEQNNTWLDQNNGNLVSVQTVSYVTVVSMYFSLNKSKHSLSKYDIWLKNFMKSVDKPLVLFCDKNSLDKLQKYRENRPVKYFVYESIWDVLRKLEVDRNMSYVDNYLNKQLDLDKEKNIHTPHLYAIWNLKTFALKSIADKNPFKSEYFIYTDAGAWRQRVSESWPDVNFIYGLVLFQKNSLIFENSFARTIRIINSRYFYSH
jgi:hypothetical protein